MKILISSHKKIFFTILFCLYFLSSKAIATHMQGNFVAQASCPMFQSKNKQTNPDNRYTTLGQSYPINEFLGAIEQPKWFRVKTSAERSPLRWVNASCGQWVKQTNLEQKQSQNACDIKNQYDSFILALSWQKGFCQFNQQKLECEKLKAKPNTSFYQKFTLHGLWPNKTSCGTRYGFCGDIKKSPRDFCDYPPLTLSTTMRAQLNSVMPSSLFGTCLQRHEFWKHGSCMTASAEHYYSLATQLTKEINQSRFVTDFMQEYLGKKVKKESFYRAFNQYFSVNAKQKLQLICKNNTLTEIRINLAKDISSTNNLSNLINSANKNKTKNRCGKYFKIL